MRVLIVGAGSDLAGPIAKSLKKYSIKMLTSKDFDITAPNPLPGDFDILINLAGVIDPCSIAESRPHEWTYQIDVNLIGAYYVTNSALKVNPKCKIIHIGSSAAKSSRANWSAYCTSKAGLDMFVRCAIDEGIDIYCLHIGRTKTKMRHELFGDEDQTTLLTPDDVAEKVLSIVEGKEPERILCLSKSQ
jgi:NAD(P)-dependent dehydrogenase (short-subunit alcohol dehydrogenase family)